jgi:two-component sensor histidine kinase/DNA-binding response OmpR family regulator
LAHEDKVNILLVDDQPAKLLAYEVMLLDLGENLIKASSARQALETLLKTEIAIVLMDVSMPELDGFELAAMVRSHPRFQRTAIIFVSAIHLSEVDFLRGYQMGAVDYVSVPVIPDVLRAKIRVFSELYRKTRELEALNVSLEARVRDRTAALEETAVRLRESEQRRSLALAAGQMGSWDWDIVTGDVQWDEGQYNIIGADHAGFSITVANVRGVIHPADWPDLEALLRGLSAESPSAQAEFRVRRLDGELRWCFGTAAATIGDDGRMLRISGVTIDITDRRRNEERQALLVREVDHRAKNVLAVVQSIVRLSRAETVPAYASAIESRIMALSRVHGLLARSRWQGADLRRLIEDELSPYEAPDADTTVIEGRPVSLDPSTAQALALALHELSTNAAKYGALSGPGGSVAIRWSEEADTVHLSWTERGGPKVRPPTASGFGLKVIERSVDAQLGGRVDFDWREDGLVCSFTIPLTRPARDNQAAEPLAAPEADPTEPRCRVLLVEDEALVAIMMVDVLTAMGLTVIGPMASVAEATGPAREAEIDAALLDVTLGSERIYPIAEILAARAIPFAFLTGYGRDGIDPDFSFVPVLPKPVDEDALGDFLAKSVKRRSGPPGNGSTRTAERSELGSAVEFSNRSAPSRTPVGDGDGSRSFAGAK